MFEHQHILIELEASFRQKELLREAEQERLVRQMRKPEASHKPLLVKALTSLGHRMVGWGQRLERFDTAPRTVLALEKSDCGE